MRAAETLSLDIGHSCGEIKDDRTPAVLLLLYSFCQLNEIFTLPQIRWTTTLIIWSWEACLDGLYPTYHVCYATFFPEQFTTVWIWCMPSGVEQDSEEKCSGRRTAKNWSFPGGRTLEQRLISKPVWTERNRSTMTWEVKMFGLYIQFPEWCAAVSVTCLNLLQKAASSSYR